MGRRGVKRLGILGRGEDLIQVAVEVSSKIILIELIACREMLVKCSKQELLYL